MTDRVAGLLGLARRAGRVSAGAMAVERALATGKAALVVVATDAGKNTRERFSRLSAQHGVPVRVWGRAVELGQAIGSSPKAVLAVCDRRMAARLLEALPA